MTHTIARAQRLLEEGQAVTSISRWPLTMRLHRKRLHYLSHHYGWTNLKQRTLRERYPADARFTSAALGHVEQKNDGRTHGRK